MGSTGFEVSQSPGTPLEIQPGGHADFTGPVGPAARPRDMQVSAAAAVTPMAGLGGLMDMTGLSEEGGRPVAAARCPVLVGREREVTILARAIGRLGEGTGSVTVLVDVWADEHTRCPSIQVESFPGAGHSIELHRGARAYVLRQVAFAEECSARAVLSHRRLDD